MAATVAPEHDHEWRWAGPAPLEHLDNCEHPELLVCLCGEKLVVRCGSSSSSACDPCGKTYRRRVRRVAISGTTRLPGDTVIMLTLTAPGDKLHGTPSGEVCACTPEGGVHLPSWNATASARWNRFCQDLRRLWGIHVQYFKATEVQRRGAIHYHVLIRFPAARGTVIHLPTIRRLAIEHGFGHSVDIAQVVDDAAAGYVAKYASKAVDQRADLPWVNHDGEVVKGQARYRVWTASRRWGLTMRMVKQDQAAWASEQAGPEDAQRRGPAGAEGAVLITVLSVTQEHEPLAGEFFAMTP